MKKRHPERRVFINTQRNKAKYAQYIRLRSTIQEINKHTKNEKQEQEQEQEKEKVVKMGKHKFAIPNESRHGEARQDKVREGKARQDDRTQI